MARATYAYQPDYAVPPGEVIAEHLEVRGWSQAEFAKRCGRSGKLISEIISGKAPVEPETALRFERVLGVSAAVWTTMEAAYRLHRRRQEDSAELADIKGFSARFPIRDMVKLGCFEKPRDDADCVRRILVFFGVGTIRAYQELYAQRAILYRRSEKVASSADAVNVWLRMGEIGAEAQPCREFEEARFRLALKTIRDLTREPSGRFFSEMTSLCRESGVTFLLVPPLPKTALSGVARWLTPRKGLIQQSLRHKSDDHFWFTFFHEAAHLLLHGKRVIYVDDDLGNGSAEEREANEWASDLLVPRRAYRTLVSRHKLTRSTIEGFAEEQGIAAGIVVGMLQHDGHLPWSHLNVLKRRLVWADGSD